MNRARLSLKSLRFFGAVAFIAPLLLRAEDTPPAAPKVQVSSQVSAYQNSVAEESVRKDTDKVQSEINQLLVELKENGLSQTDAALLANAATHLKSLSQDDMQKVINTLQTASMATQEQDRQKSMVTAFQDQGALTIKLKALAAELAAQEAQKELPAKLENLIARQSANIRQTVKLPDVKLPQLNAGQASVQGVVSSEQTSIEGEINLLYQSLSDAMASPPADASSANLMKAVLDSMNTHPLRDTATEATQMTAKGPFGEATSSQKAVRDYLTMVLRAALSKLDAVGKLQQAKTQMDQISSDQKDLADAAKQSKIDGKTLAERQAEINDRTAAAQAVLKTVSPTAAAQLDPVQQAMQKSSDALDKAQNPADTAPQQQAVAQALDKAQTSLNQEMADAQTQEDQSPVDKLAQLQQLQDELAKAQQNQQLSSADLNKLQQQAADLSTPAADKIADAQDTLQQNTPDPSQQNQQNQQTPASPQNPQDPSQQNSQQQQNQSNPTSQQNQQNQQSSTPQQSPQDSPQQDSQQQQQNQQSPNSQQGQKNQQNSSSPQDQSPQTANSQQSSPQQNQQSPGSPQTPPQGQPNQPDPNSQPGQNPNALTAQQSQQNEQNEQAADKLLAQASDALKQQADAMQAAAQAYQALSQESQQISQAQQQTQDANQSMKSGSQLSDAAHDMAQAQSSVDKAAQDPSASGLSPDTKAALQKASDALKDGTMQAVQAKSGEAKAAGEKASDALKDAQSGLAQAMDQVKQGMQGDEQRQRDEMGKMMQPTMDHAGFVADGEHHEGSMMGGRSTGTVAGSAQVMGGLKPKDRAAIAQFQEEKSPPEYAAQVQQYMKNLADASETK